MAVDVVGYSRLMGRDESGTLQRLREHRKIRFDPALARNHGRMVKLTGDGALVEFASKGRYSSLTGTASNEHPLLGSARDISFLNATTSMCWRARGVRDYPKHDACSRR